MAGVVAAPVHRDMRFESLIPAILSCILAMSAPHAVSGPSGGQWYPPDWKDTDGNLIQARGAGILFHKGVYYLYGENKDGPTKPGGCGARVDLIGIQCYSSRDLVRWKNLGIVLAPVPGDESHDLHPSKILERPKVIYNRKTKKFVMWVHIDAWDYSAGLAGVAVSDSPDGPFQYLGSMKPNGHDSRDLTVFQDTDGSAYLVHSAERNATTVISELREDYLAPSGRFERIFAGRSMEAPIVFKHDGRYWFIASGCTGWAPNAARSAVATSIWGPWKELGNPAKGRGARTTFRSQGTFVLPPRGNRKEFLFMADRWNIDDLGRSGYLWLPLQWRNGRPVLENPDGL